MALLCVSAAVLIIGFLLGLKQSQPFQLLSHLKKFHLSLHTFPFLLSTQNEP